MKLKFSLPEPPILVYYFTKFIGLAPFTLKNNIFYPPTLLGKLYSVFLAATYLFVTLPTGVSMISKIISTSFSTFAKTTITIQDFTRYLATFLTLLLSVLMHKKILYIIEKSSIIGNELKSLGIKEDLRKSCGNLFVTIVWTNAVVVATLVVLTLLEPNWPISTSIIYFIDKWYIINVTLIFVQMLFFIKRRLILLNEKLSDLFGQAGHRRCLDRSQMFVACRNPGDATGAGIEDLTDLQHLQQIELLHLQLCDLIVRTTRLFAIPIVLTSLNKCIELIVSCFWMYLGLQNSGQLSSAAEIVGLVRSILCSLLRILLVIVEFFVIAHASVKTCREGNATKAVLFKVWYTWNDPELEDEFILFSLQLLHTPVTVSAFGFFDLGYSYLYKIFCSVVAYLIIVIQFGVPESIPHL